MKIGVIVGRFQCHKLTDGHKELIRKVLCESDRILMFIGVSPRPPDFKNPFPYEMRKQIVLEFFGSIYRGYKTSKEIEIHPFYDVFDIPLWSSNLDKKVKELTSENDSVKLYGSRDSFIFNYSGTYPTKEIESNGDNSATDIRNEIKNMDISNTDETFRKGVLWGVLYASSNR